MSTTETSAPASFSETIRSRSWALHQEAEGSGFLELLMKGELVREAYTAMVAQHHHAYAALEEAAAVMRGDAVAAGFAPPVLDRLAALDADLRYLHGPGWAEAYPASPATTRYVERIRERCFDWAGGFVAHHYTRYLGDMSGGQFIARVMRRHYELPGTDGTAFYDFTAVGDLDAFKNDYRRRLDEAPWDADERERVIEEILYAYRINSEVLEDLGTGIGAWRRTGAQA